MKYIYLPCARSPCSAAAKVLVGRQNWVGARLIYRTIYFVFALHSKARGIFLLRLLYIRNLTFSFLVILSISVIIFDYQGTVIGHHGPYLK